MILWKQMKKRQANNEKAKGHGRWSRRTLTLKMLTTMMILTYLDESNLMESVEEAEEIMMQLTGAQIVEIIDEFMNSKEESQISQPPIIMVDYDNPWLFRITYLRILTTRFCLLHY